VSDSRTITSRLPASDRRHQLLEAALDLFSRKGFDGTTTKEIAAAAGVTEAIIFRHFPSKQALYSAVIDYRHESGEIAATFEHWQSFMDANDDEGLFGAMIRTVADGYRRDARWNRVLLFAALEGHQAAMDQHRQRSFPIFERLSQYVARRQSEGAIRPGKPHAVIATVIGTAAHYAMMTGLFGFCTNSDDAQISEDFLQVILHGIKAKQ
jgi:TetR/AcrR family transcriptional regulator